MTGTQVIVLVLLVAAFAAGWFARGGDAPEAEEEAEAAPEAALAPPTEVLPATPLPQTPAQVHAPVPADRIPRPLDVALRALDLANAAYEAAVDRWLDEGVEITPAGRAAVGELERAVRRLDLAAGRLEAAQDDHSREVAEVRIAISAFTDAIELLGAYRENRAIDAATDRKLRELEDEVEQCRAALGASAV